MPKRIQYDGKTHVFPDDFTDADISAALDQGESQPKQRTAAEVDRYMRDRYTQAFKDPKAPQSWGDLVPKDVHEGVSAVGDFLKGAIVNPIKGMYDTAKGVITDPAATMDRVVDSQYQTAVKASDAWKRGDLSSAAGYGLGAAIPVVGPVAAGIGEKIGSGKVAEGLGEGASLIASVSPENITKPAVKKVVEIATRPGTGRIVGGTAAVAAAPVALATGHPYIAGEMAVGGVGAIRSGMKARSNALADKLYRATEAAKASTAGAPASPTVDIPAPAAESQFLPQLPGPRSEFIAETNTRAGTADIPTVKPSADGVEILPPKGAEAPFDPKSLPPDPIRKADWYKQAYEDMRARKLGSPDKPAPAQTGVILQEDGAPLMKMGTEAPGDAVTIPGSPTPPPEVFKTKARAERAPKVELIAKHFTEAGIGPEEITQIQPSQWRDVSKALGIELPKSLPATIRDVQKRVMDMQAPKAPAATGPAPSAAMMKKIASDPKLAKAALDFAEMFK